jgi:hypothetical protein
MPTRDVQHDLHNTELHPVANDISLVTNIEQHSMGVSTTPSSTAVMMQEMTE